LEKEGDVSNYEGHVATFEGETYSTFRIRLEEVSVVDWEFQF
jgi:hypothetical protein